MLFSINNFVIFVIGPTCVGKTKLSIELFEYFPVEVVNIDSSMIYRGMDIGTGKPDYLIMNKFKHHLIDIKDPNDKYSVWNFCIDAYLVVFDCLSRGKIPLFVGGTMMYVWYIQNFFNFCKQNLFKKENNEFKIFNYLADIKKNNIFFVQNFSKIYRDNFYFFEYFNLKIFKFTFINIFLVPFDKDIFYCKIKDRLIDMLNRGFLDEVESLRFMNTLTLNMQSMKSIGYKDLWLYLDNKISFSCAKESILRSTIDLSNKQLKWIKKFNDNVFYIENKERFLIKSVNIISKFLS